MRWKTKIKVEPYIGDRRYILKFAWLPKKLDDGYTVFLEHYGVHQEYQRHIWNAGMSMYIRWVTTRTSIDNECPYY